jgi:hypothetical protein
MNNDRNITQPSGKKDQAGSSLAAGKQLRLNLNTDIICGLPGEGQKEFLQKPRIHRPDSPIVSSRRIDDSGFGCSFLPDRDRGANIKLDQQAGQG